MNVGQQVNVRPLAPGQWVAVVYRKLDELPMVAPLQGEPPPFLEAVIQEQSRFLGPGQARLNRPSQKLRYEPALWDEPLRLVVYVEAGALAARRTAAETPAVDRPTGAP